MPADPFRIFRDGGRRQDTLKALWPDLYDALAGAPAPGEDVVLPVVFCVIGVCPNIRRDLRPHAVARLHKGGPPACGSHVKAYADRPGGHPLFPDRSKPR